MPKRANAKRANAKTGKCETDPAARATARTGFVEGKKSGSILALNASEVNGVAKLVTKTEQEGITKAASVF